MGRYYSGDIEGKFWVAVQPSNDADFFGVTGVEPNYLEYYFEGSNKPAIERGIAKCRRALGENKQKLDSFFASNEMYNDEMVAKQTGIPLEQVPGLLEWYARLELGEKILKCVNDIGKCYFEAEL